MAVAFTDIYSPFLCLAKPPLTGGFDHQVGMSLPGAFCGARHMKQPGGASMGFNDPPLVLGHARESTSALTHGTPPRTSCGRGRTVDKESTDDTVVSVGLAVAAARLCTPVLFYPRYVEQ